MLAAVVVFSAIGSRAALIGALRDRSCEVSTFEDYERAGDKSFSMKQLLGCWLNYTPAV